jgi:AcrR family transcriptional regulator
MLRLVRKEEPGTKTGTNKRVGLDREAIRVAAMGLMDDEGIDALSTRRLASELGVTPMALYRHVENKDEILVLVIDELLRRLPVPAETRWDRWLEAWALSLRQLLAVEPTALQLFNRQPVATPAACGRFEAAHDRLCAAGFKPDASLRLVSAVHTFTIGFAVLEAARRSSVRLAATERGEDADAFGDAIRAQGGDEQFLFGLRALISGCGPTPSATHPGG